MHRTKLLMAFALLVLLAAPSLAATARKGCPKGCHHRAKAECVAVYKVATQSNSRASLPVSAPVSAAPSLLAQLVQGFEVQLGFRWQTEVACPEPGQRVPDPIQVHDPFFLGAGVRLPLARNVAAFGNWDRDWTDAPHWQTRVGLVVTPWARP